MRIVCARNSITGKIDDYNLVIFRMSFSYGPKTVRPQGLHKIARNVVQIVFRSRRYFCIAWPIEWQKEED